MSLFHKPEASLRTRDERRVRVRHERRGDVAAREQLLDAAFGADRFAKSSERLREGRVPASGLAFVAMEDDRMIGTIRLWSITAGPNRPCLLLGPLAVAAAAQNRGIGATLMQHALRKAASRRYSAIILVGDIGYYSRFGFSAEMTGALCMPGPYECDRLLGCELVPEALQGARGMIAAYHPRQSRWSELLESVARSSPAIPRRA
jgi:predicted N-acetyltransferase YhbS